MTYYIFLLFIMFLLVILMKNNMVRSPKKIKIYMQIVITLLLIRYLSLLFISIVENARFIYYLKPILFLNYLCIPLISLALIYVYLRYDKIGFKAIYLIAGIMSAIYFAGMKFLSGKIILDSKYGYRIVLDNEIMIYILFLALIGILFLFCVYNLDKPNSNSNGIWLLIIGFIIVIIENTLHIGGFKIFPYPIIGDGAFIGIISLAVNTFKRYDKNLENA